MNDPFRAEAPVPSISSGFSLMNTELQEDPTMQKLNTNRVFNQYDDTNLIDDMISHDEIQPKIASAIETQTMEEKKESHSIACGDDIIENSHSIACGDDKIQQVTTTTSTDARDMVKDLVKQNARINSFGCNTDATNTHDKQIDAMVNTHEIAS